MAAQIPQFVANKIALSADATVSNKDLLDAFYKYTSGTSGRNQLYRAIEQMDGVSRTKTHFRGVSIVSQVQQTVAESQPTQVQQVVHTTPTLSAYELACIELKQRKLASQEAQKVKDQELALKDQELKQRKLALIEAQKARDQELKQRKLASQESMKQQELDLTRELKQIDIDEKAKDRAFMREENNKNRRMHMALRHNKYLDFEVYGNPSKQYIDRDSMVNVLGFHVFNTNNQLKPEVLKAIELEATKVCKAVPVYEQAATSESQVIEVRDAIDLIKTISKQADAPAVMSLVDRVETIQTVAVSDDLRSIPSSYQAKKAIQDVNKHSTGKHKLKYVRAINKLRESNGTILVSCACCSAEMDLQSSACHRGHDIPRSDGGDWSIDNVYLVCASCNTDMSDRLSVAEYKVELYVGMIQAQSDESCDVSTKK
jgi:hypothetical protein